MTDFITNTYKVHIFSFEVVAPIYGFLYSFLKIKKKAINQRNFKQEIIIKYLFLKYIYCMYFVRYDPLQKNQLVQSDHSFSLSRIFSFSKHNNLQIYQQNSYYLKYSCAQNIGCLLFFPISFGRTYRFHIDFFSLLCFHGIYSRLYAKLSKQVEKE